MNEKWINRILLLAVVLFFISLIWTVEVEHQKFQKIPRIFGDGNYQISYEENIPRETVGLYTVGDGKIFLFYIESELVNVYDTSGNFLYGLQFPDGHNGRSDLMYRDDLLYVDARSSGIYIFDEDKLVDFQEQSIYNDRHSQLRRKFRGEYNRADREAEYHYDADSNTVFRTVGQSTRALLVFPRISPTVGFLVLVFALVVSPLCVFDAKNRRRK